MKDHLITEDDRFELIEDAAALVFPFYADAHLLNAVKQNLVKYSNELLSALVQFFRSNDECVDRIKASVTKGLSEETIREHLEFFPLMKGFSHRFRSSMVESLRTYHQLPHTTDFTALGPEVISQCKVLIRAALTIEDSGTFHNGSCARGIIDQRLVDLIIGHVESPDRLLSIIEKRKTADPLIISDILSSEAPAISDGML